MLNKFERLQNIMSQRVKLIPLSRPIKYVAGVDVGYFLENNLAQAAVVVMSFPELKVVEVKKTLFTVSFPYIPGFLSFREVPGILETLKILKVKPELLIVDGQGIAHPRKAGIAVHLGVKIGIPTIGCAKRPLLKVFWNLEEKRGAKIPIYLNEELVGYAVRTQSKVKPVFVSPGNLITVDEAVDWILKTTTKFRLPEPLRLAHLFSKQRD